MQIAVLVRDPVMSPVMSYPPQWAPLGCACAKPCSNELHASPSFKRVMTKFPVIEAGYAEASHQINNDRDNERKPTNPDDKNEQAREMHGRVRKRELEEPRKIGLIVVHRSGCNQLNSSGRVPEVSQELDLTIHAVESITRISDE